jgi:hypothetical protein
MKRTFAADPVTRYAQLVALGAQTSPELTPDALEQVIAEAPGGDEVSSLSEHLAEHSRLTLEQAKPVVKAALDQTTAEGRTDPKAKATAVSDAAAGAAGASANVELSDPVMLEPLYRIIFAGLLFLAFVGCVACITTLGNESSAQESALIGLAILGVLALIAILVLVMGYKNVKISGAGPSGRGSSS